MTDLEDRLLKKNIPGKYSWWDEYQADRHDANDDEDDDSDKDKSSPHGTDCGYKGPESSTFSDEEVLRTSVMSNRRCNTGVRGVMADYRIHKQIEADKRAEEQREHYEAVNRIQSGSALGAEEMPFSAAAAEDQKRFHSKGLKCPSSPNDSDDSTDDDEDSDVLKSYREKRLFQMMRNSATTRPLFETVTDTTAIQFAEIVDATDPRVFLIVHLYESYIPECTNMNHIMDQLASTTMTYCRFIRLRASDAKPDFDPIGLPSISIYRGGNLVANLTPVTDSLPHSPSTKCTAINLKCLLESYGVVNPQSK